MRDAIIKYPLLLSGALMLSVFCSCQTSPYRSDLAGSAPIVHADCVEVNTKIGLKYYVCEDPISYCFLTAAGGISCFLKEFLEEEEEEI